MLHELNSHLWCMHWIFIEKSYLLSELQYIFIFQVDLQNLLSHHLCDIRELAFNLLSRYLNKHPECAFTVLRQSFLPCLSVNSKHPGVTESALKRLPEMMLLAPRLAPAMLRAAAHLAVVGSNPTALTTCADLINLANLETLLSIPNPAPRPSSSRWYQSLDSVTPCTLNAVLEKLDLFLKPCRFLCLFYNLWFTKFWRWWLQKCKSNSKLWLNRMLHECLWRFLSPMDKKDSK